MTPLKRVEVTVFHLCGGNEFIWLQFSILLEYYLYIYIDMIICVYTGNSIYTERIGKTL